MKIDATLLGLLSDFCLDAAKGFFAATFVTPSLGSVSSLGDIILILTRGLLNVILLLALSWWLASLQKQYESNKLA